jgi:hypothetical protein
MQYNNIEINVLIKGKPITEYPHNGQVYVEGRPGSEFEIEVFNHNPHRVEAVVSVDGLSIIDGKDAGPQSSGYLLNAHERVVIPGWKLNDQQVAAFIFTDKSRGYASQMGKSRNTGVIGLLAYGEKVKAPVYIAPTYGSVLRGTGGPIWGDNISWGSACDSFSPSGLDASMPTGPELNRIYTSSSTTRSGTRSGTKSRRITQNAIQTSVNNLGTGFGQAEDFATTQVSFDRGDMLALTTMFYDDARGLRALGIDLSRRARVRETQTPNAFPGLSGCVPPAGWRG